ncbi:MAG: helix-turn-helix domain-containing protein [bacterium]|nr:helix-turn-helix domain-containing protein [bacterium]
MNFTNETSDDAILVELGERLARLRLNRNTTQSALADEAGISLRTLQRLEDGQPTQLVNLVRVARALDLLENLEALVPAPAPSPLQQIARRGRERRRASSRPNRREIPEPWSWEDEE